MRKIDGRQTGAREAVRNPASSRARTQARTTRFNSDPDDSTRAPSLWQLLLQPSALFCTALLALLVVSGMKVWESGLLDPLVGPRGAGPVEDGPIRFAPHARPPAKEYVAAPDPAPAAAEAAAASEDAAAGDE